MDTGVDGSRTSAGEIDSVLHTQPAQLGQQPVHMVEKDRRETGLARPFRVLGAIVDEDALRRLNLCESDAGTVELDRRLDVPDLKGKDEMVEMAHRLGIFAEEMAGVEFIRVRAE
jgi:hypothetical protein